MRLTLRDGLPWVTLTIEHAGKRIEVPDVLVDTGSAGTMLSADIAGKLGIQPSPSDKLFFIRGVGGQEVVYTFKIDGIGIGHSRPAPFEVEIGAMDYGLPINGILGMDYLRAKAARMDLGRLNIEFR